MVPDRLKSFVGDEDSKHVPTEQEAVLWEQIMHYKELLKQQVEHMDKSLNVVLKKHEFEYMQAYNIHVNRKEGELRQLIKQMNDRTTDAQAKDKKI